MAGIDPDKGTLRWEVPLGTPRGSNEIERLADLIGPALRLGTRICARSFQVVGGLCRRRDRAGCCGRATPAASTPSAVTTK